MKKLLLKISNEILSKEQMKRIRGGYGGVSSCSATCKDGTKVECSGYKCEAFEPTPDADAFCVFYPEETTQWPSSRGCSILA